MRQDWRRKVKILGGDALPRFLAIGASTARPWRARPRGWQPADLSASKGLPAIIHTAYCPPSPLPPCSLLSLDLSGCDKNLTDTGLAGVGLARQLTRLQLAHCERISEAGLAGLLPRLQVRDSCACCCQAPHACAHAESARGCCRQQQCKRKCTKACKDRTKQQVCS